MVVVSTSGGCLKGKAGGVGEKEQVRGYVRDGGAAPGPMIESATVPQASALASNYRLQPTKGATMQPFAPRNIETMSALGFLKRHVPPFQ